MIAYSRILKLFFIFTCLFIIFLGKIVLEKEKQTHDKIYPNVYINQFNVGLKTKNEVINLFNKENKKLNQVTFIFSLKDKPIATISAKEINLHYDVQGLSERAFLIGRSSYFLSRYYQKIASLFLNKRFYIMTNIDYQENKINELINKFEEDYNQPAKNALFRFENNRVTSFRQEKNGFQILGTDIKEQVKKSVAELKTNYQENINIKVKSKIIYPEITLDKINQYGIKELIGEGRSDFSHSIPERIHNIILASSKLNGILILKDKIFSFNENVGDISSNTGYKPAYIIKEGKTILGDGGGVCQVSTTLFRAALNTGLPIIERHPHAYRVYYYENDSKPGFDATVFAPSVDLKFKNDTPAAILIQTEIDKKNNLLIFKFYGKKDNRQIEISPITIWDISPPPQPLYQDDPTLKKGVIKQIDFPAWGAKTNFNYKIIYPDKKILETNFLSVYKPWQAVYLVGTAD